MQQLSKAKWRQDAVPAYAGKVNSDYLPWSKFELTESGSKLKFRLPIGYHNFVRAYRR
jgi:hypothetical protein